MLATYQLHVKLSMLFEISKILLLKYPNTFKILTNTSKIITPFKILERFLDIESFPRCFEFSHIFEMIRNAFALRHYLYPTPSFSNFISWGGGETQGRRGDVINEARRS